MIFHIAIKLFIAFIPFLYYVQVQLFRSDFVPVPYLLLCLAILFVFYNNWRKIPSKHGSLMLMDDLVVFFLIMNAGWVIFELIFYSFDDGLRVLIYYVIPILLYFYIVWHARDKDVKTIVMILAFTSLAVGVELLYEYYWNLILLSTSPFQNKNIEYVAAIGSGGELPQLANIMYRNPGILEHVHATATFIGLGFVALVSLYYMKKKKTYLLCAIVMFLILILSGGKTALISTIIGIGVMFIAINIYINKKRNKILLTGYIILSGVILSSFIIIYSISIPGASLSGEMAEKSFITGIIPEALGDWYKGVRQMPQGILFGFGPGVNSMRRELDMGSDDFFVADLLGRYGVLGSLIFYSLLIIFWLETFTTLKKYSLEINNEDQHTLLLSLCIVLILLITTIHSGVLVRKAIFPWLFIFYGIGRRYISGVYTSLVNSRSIIRNYDVRQ